MKRDAIGDPDLQAYLDGELEPARLQDVRRHLASNPADAKRVERWRKQNEAIRRAFEVTREPAPRAAEPKPDGRHDPKSDPKRDPLGALRLDHARSARRRRQAVATSAGFVAGAAVALLAATGFERTARPPLAADIVSSVPSAAPKRARLAWRTFAHGADRARPGLEKDAILQWTALPRLPDFGGEGLDFVSAHPMPGEAEPAVFLLYESAARSRVGLIAERNAESDLRPVLDDDGGLRCLYWRGGGYAWALVGQADADTLRALRQAVTEAAGG